MTQYRSMRGKSLQRMKGNRLKVHCFDVETGEHDWISGPKKDSQGSLYASQDLRLMPVCTMDTGLRLAVVPYRHLATSETFNPLAQHGRQMATAGPNQEA